MVMMTGGRSRGMMQLVKYLYIRGCPYCIGDEDVNADDEQSLADVKRDMRNLHGVTVHL